MSAPPSDASLCPLCGRSNQCAILAGADPLNCWCMDTPVAPDALARIPEPLRNKACLCPACALGTDRPRPPASADMMSPTQPPRT
ncbi:hypothetical protein CHL79_10990 [Delftia acidovorans]|uniref:cysteine-rich CWC family protein n=1 Tax=Delftia acidovorans TaxID=80866 RepID=UPI000BC308DB|nr:cysteine-rich CWC family protein [Delftia acidovorans]ATH12898.1 hypothetical protein CHL79_10990 [Delftia acidovorans]